MQLVIAEKPSVAAEIAKVIGATQRNKDCYTGSNWCVTWMYGHLLELDAVEADGKWSLENLPILPEKFILKPIGGGKDEDIKKRIEAISHIAKSCSGIVVATDAGREGELIFRRLYRYIGCKLPFTRLWINSLTEAGIKEGFANLRPGTDYDNLGKAAELRAMADWLVGINATRALTISSGYNQFMKGAVLSLGRVQTPVLCMICERYLEHKNFKREAFWFIDGESVQDGVTFRWRSCQRYKSQEDGEYYYGLVQSSKALLVESVETKRVNEEPPLLHDIASLQKAANALYGYAAYETLAFAQSLYEKMLISYPRTDSRYIPEDVFDTVPSILRTIEGDLIYGEQAKIILEAGLTKRSVDYTGEKITDHHAIIPTNVRPRNLSEGENNIYNLVMLRFLEAFSGICVADLTRVKFSAGGVEVETKGRKDVFLGWRAVRREEISGEDLELDDVDEIEMNMRPLPVMTKGQLIPISKSQLSEDQTRPQPLYSDATLLTAMENAGKKIENKQASAALREVGGIGTKATRAEIIRVLLSRGYIERAKKRLVPTALGMDVYEAIHDADVANVELTARWEMALEEIATKGIQASVFLNNIKGFTRRITSEIISAKGVSNIRQKLSAFIPDCPRCGAKLRLLEQSAWCESCNWTLWRNVGGKRLSDDVIRDVLKKDENGKINGKTSLLSGFRSRDGREFSAIVEIDDDGRTRLVYPDTGKSLHITCPLCKKEMTVSNRSVSCSCGLNVWRKVYGITLTDAQMKKLLTKGRSGLVTLVTKDGKKYKADLELQRDGSLVRIYENKNKNI